MVCMKKVFLIIIFIILFVTVITFLSLFFTNKNSILTRIGHETFGGCCYNLTIAKWAYTELSKTNTVKYSISDDKESNNDKKYNSKFKSPKWANHQLARIYFVQGDYNTALLYIDREIELYPDNLNAYYIKGLIYGFMNNNHEAIEVFKYYTSKTNTWAGHNDLAWLQFKIGDYNAALATIDKVKDIYVDNVWILNSRAIILYNLHRIEEAKKAINKAKIEVGKMTPERWGASYPGNDPAIYGEGLEKMKQSVEDNYKLIYQ